METKEKSFGAARAASKVAMNFRQRLLGAMLNKHGPIPTAVAIVRHIGPVATQAVTTSLVTPFALRWAAQARRKLRERRKSA